MRALLVHPYTLLLARWVLGFVFLRSGLGKALDRKGTLQTVLNYQVLPRPVARVYGTLLPWVELTLAILLLSGLWTQAAAYGLSLLLVIIVRYLVIQDHSAFSAQNTITHQSVAEDLEKIVQTLLVLMILLFITTANNLANDVVNRLTVAAAAGR